MLQKVSQFFTLILTALTLVILLIFLGQQPDTKQFAKHKDITDSVQSLEKSIDERLGDVENVNGLDALNEKYTTLAEENATLRTELDALKKTVNEKATASKTEPKPAPKVETKKQPEVLKNETVSVLVDELNFRHSASLSAPIQGLLMRGTKLEVLDKTVIEKDGHKWVKVGLPSGDVGYIAREYVQ